MKLKVLVIILCLCSIVLFCACNETGQYLIFGTFVEIDLSGVKAGKTVSKIEKRFVEIENEMSVQKGTSDVYKINNAKAGERVYVCVDTLKVLETAKNIYEMSNGAFDPTVYPLVKLWKFSADTYVGAPNALPTESEIETALKSVGFDKISIDFDGGFVTKSSDAVMIDLGGLAKGFAAGEGLSIASGGKGIINVGGNIVAVGRDLKVGVQNPRGEGYVGTFTLSCGQSVSTSGDYERHYFYKGVNYHHIISPFSGYPTGIKDDSDLISVTVVSDKYTLCDAVATAVMVLGKNDGKALIERLGLCGVIIDKNLNITVVGNLDFQKK